MDKVVVDGKVAVLYSPGFGAGWSTWNHRYSDILIFHPKLVEMVESGRQEKISEEWFKKTFDIEDDYLYFGGATDLRVEWLPIGTRFLINEYDGSESVQLLDSVKCFVA